MLFSNIKKKHNIKYYIIYIMDLTQIKKLCASCTDLNNYKHSEQNAGIPIKARKQQTKSIKKHVMYCIVLYCIANGKYQGIEFN